MRAQEPARLFVAGEQWQARIYHARTGVLLAERPQETTPRPRGIWDIDADGDRFAMVGATRREGESTRLDFAARGYRVVP